MKYNVLYTNYRYIITYIFRPYFSHHYTNTNIKRLFNHLEYYNGDLTFTELIYCIVNIN